MEIQNVSKQYRDPNKHVFDAVSDVSLTLEEHRIYALVGESGCGKSTLSRLILGLEAPTSGRVLLDGAPVSRKGKAGRIQTAKAVQLVLQDGASSLDPHFTVYQAIAEPIRTVLQLPKEEERQRAIRREQRAERRRQEEELAKSKPKKAAGRAVIQCAEDGTEIQQFETVTAAAEAMGIHPKGIRDAAIGKQKRAAGFVWRYAETLEAEE